MRNRPGLKGIVISTLAMVMAATPALADTAATRTVKADVSREIGAHSNVPLEVVGAGRAAEAMRADFQGQLDTVQEEIGFNYLRMHGLLNDEMAVYDEDKQGNPIYNFQYVDALYDALLAKKIRPFVELTFMPSKLTETKTTVFWWKGNTSLPKDHAKWAGLMRALMVHWKERYGEEEITKWYYEVWNEPDIRGFFPHPLEEYFKLYKTTSEAIRAECAKCRIGGPATAVPYASEQAFEKWIIENPAPIDFIALHAYGVEQGFLDEDGTAGTIIDPNPERVAGRMRHSRELLDASPLRDKELHFTEWSSSYTPTDYMHDQYHQASFIMNVVKRATPHVDSLSYWTFTDIFEENGPRFTPFHGGFGMLNLQGIKKPSFHAFKFLKRLGDTDVESNDAASWITKSKDGSVQALVWDYSPVVPPKGQTDQSFYNLEQPTTDKGRLALEIAGMKDGRYRLDVYQIGYKQNDPFTAYVGMGSPNQLTRKQVSELNAVSTGAPSFTGEVSVKNGRFTRDVPLRANDIFEFVLTPVK